MVFIAMVMPPYTTEKCPTFRGYPAAPAVTSPGCDRAPARPSIAGGFGAFVRLIAGGSSTKAAFAKPGPPVRRRLRRRAACSNAFRHCVLRRHEPRKQQRRRIEPEAEDGVRRKTAQPRDVRLRRLRCCDPEA